ncbi:MAG TPA: DUF1573 domain-containing protein [Opitutaceae bacterium]|nr:DUF1573 domain-containing protein [Opitutaceae bacterium]
MRVCAIILLLPLGALSAPAALEWKIKDLQLKTEIGQEQAVAVYPFRNTGTRPVRILALDPSCSCVEAEPDREVYAPGATGAIRVDVALAGYVGHLRRSVAVETDDPDQKFTELTLTLDIPEPVAIMPRFLFWAVGEPAAQKSLIIAVADPAKASIGAVESDNPRFAVRLMPGSPGQYRLLVAPADTGRPAEATVRLHAMVGGREQAYIIYLAVKAPAGS